MHSVEHPAGISFVLFANLFFMNFQFKKNKLVSDVGSMFGMMKQWF